MKTLLISVLALPLILACGKPVKHVLMASPTPSASPEPIVSGSPTPVPNASGLKWTSPQINTAVSSCKNNTDTTYTKDQWNNVCTCVYQVVAKNWDYNTYQANTNYYVQILDENGVIDSCMKQAGML